MLLTTISTTPLVFVDIKLHLQLKRLRNEIRVSRDFLSRFTPFKGK